MILDSRGLVFAPGQCFGHVRILPILRDDPDRRLRLAVRPHGPTAFSEPDGTYMAYMPYGLYARVDGTLAVPEDTRIGRKELASSFWKRGVRGLGEGTTRWLPLHLALDGFLALEFGGPDIARSYWVRSVRDHGLQFRMERSTAVSAGLAAALRVFEIHPNQVGCALFIDDVLASITVFPNPEDYRASHRSLVKDCFGPTVMRHGWAHRRSPQLRVTLDAEDFSDVRGALERAREGLHAFSASMVDGVFGRTVRSQLVRKLGDYRLSRFMTGTEVTRVPREGEHIGEVICDADGAVAYLKTFRLDRGPVRRAAILEALREHAWDLHSWASARGDANLGRIIVELDAAGLGWLIDIHQIPKADR